MLCIQTLTWPLCLDRLPYKALVRSNDEEGPCYRGDSGPVTSLFYGRFQKGSSRYDDMDGPVSAPTCVSDNGGRVHLCSQHFHLAFVS